MAQNKKKIKSKQGVNQDDALIKKLPGLLALCEFVLIPFLVISPSTAGEIQIAAITDIPHQVLPSPQQVMQITVTAYSSTEDQTDQTPFHTANGKDVEDGIVAANFLPLGTRLRIPEAFGDKIFTVEDRMHERFDRRIDIWMPSREEAKAFGIKHLRVEIL